MSHHPSHRGAAPEDARLFGPRQLPALRLAASELNWLLDRGYALRSALELVGNRHGLRDRQRLALARSVCSAESLAERQRRRLELEALRGQELWLDGYNVLTVIESALAGGMVLIGRDGCCRDIAGIHRRYRKVHETLPGLKLIGETAAARGVSRCRWFLDKPVSNSGRLKTLIFEVAAAASWETDVDVVFSPDHVLSHTDQIIASSDGIILERCQRWVNLTREIVAKQIPHARVVDLSAAS